MVLTGVLVCGAVCAFRPLRDFDLPWNLATGRLIWQTGSIPRIDDLAFTHSLHLIRQTRAR